MWLPGSDEVIELTQDSKMGGITPMTGKHGAIRALVCGASQGIGRSIAQALAGDGMNLTLLARNESELEKTRAAILAEFPVDVDIATCELEDLARVEVLAGELLKKNGVYQVLINNSGGPASGKILDANVGDFEVAFRRLVLSGHIFLKAFLSGMQKASFGRIVNIVSTSVREPIPNLGVSNTIRGATAAWAKSVAGELPPGITINNVLPGYTRTGRLENLKSKTASHRGVSPEQIEQEWIDQTPERRLASPDEIAEAVRFLCSPRAGFIRGVSLPVDGGRLKSI